jgi:hypothetical protein
MVIPAKMGSEGIGVSTYAVKICPVEFLTLMGNFAEGVVVVPALLAS